MPGQLSISRSLPAAWQAGKRCGAGRSRGAAAGPRRAASRGADYLRYSDVMLNPAVLVHGMRSAGGMRWRKDSGMSGVASHPLSLRQCLLH